MKTYMLEWTEDKGESHKTMLVSAENYTKAYLQGVIELSTEAEITDLFEI